MKRKAAPDFRALWARLRTVYHSSGMVRKVAVLDNHKDKKETICKKLGVVCGADIDRISASLRR